MFHIFLGCFSWVFFYITLKSHFRQRTDLGDWDFYVDEEGEGCVTYTYRRDPAILGDSSGEEEEEEQPQQQKEEGEAPPPTAEEGHSDGSETLDEYIVTSDDDEVAEAEKENEKEKEEEEEEEEPTVECHSEEEAELEDVDHVEPARSPSTLIDTWTSFPARGFDAFMEELLTGLTDEEKVQAESAINRVHNIQQKDWLDTLKTVVVSKSFDLTGCSGRVRARLMAPSIWLDYTSGEKELSEYLFAISIYRWVTGR